MTTTEQKHEILRSLDAMDSSQADEVLRYIGGLLEDPRERAEYRAFKKAAIVEIRKALRKPIR